MASLQPHCRIHFVSPRQQHIRYSRFFTSRWRQPSFPFSGKIKVLTSRESFRKRDGAFFFRCSAETNAQDLVVGGEEEEGAGKEERPPFEISLAVILAGFAFEAYTTPPENIGKREVDAAGCRTVYLSESFVREIYDGQLFIKLKRGINFPALDPWGTSDPYIVMDVDGQVAKSNIKWGTKEPQWNEEFAFNIKLPPMKKLEVAAWDANLITPHKRMGNAEISLEGVSDGNLLEELIELEGIGGGGKVMLEIRYKGFEEIKVENKWGKIPFISEFLRRSEFESVLRKLLDSKAVPARQFVEYAFGQLESSNDGPLNGDKLLTSDTDDCEGEDSSDVYSPAMDLLSSSTKKDCDVNGDGYTENDNEGKRVLTEKDFWGNLADVVSQNVAHKLGLPMPAKFKWDGVEILKKMGRQSRKIAEAGYIDSGLATPDTQEADDTSEAGLGTIKSSLPDIKKATQELLKQTDNVLGALMVLKSAVPESSKAKLGTGTGNSSKAESEEKQAEEMKVLFKSAESAMEAWAVLATSLGHPSFIRSEFEKICFLDNDITDTQVAIWRDSMRKRLVIAFRGTEQTKWKDLQTDLMLAPSGLNPERIGGDFKQEVQVHSGFLSAYDSVRIRIVSLLKQAIGFIDNDTEPPSKWHIYVTGHSLGGALATLLALELASSRLAKQGVIVVTMYNFGSPRVGNKKFADIYNLRVNDSWRVVNHRDIIPTIPRLMGYCHVAHPVYLSAGGLRDALENIDLERDGYEGDVIGEATPDILVNEFMKGEMELIDKILQTEISIFNAIRDGSALMQHMEDFYYISLLESVRAYYQNVEEVEDAEADTSDESVWQI